MYDNEIGTYQKTINALYSNTLFQCYVDGKMDFWILHI